MAEACVTVDVRGVPQLRIAVAHLEVAATLIAAAPSCIPEDARPWLDAIGAALSAAAETMTPPAAPRFAPDDVPGAAAGSASSPAPFEGPNL